MSTLKNHFFLFGILLLVTSYATGQNLTEDLEQTYTDYRATPREVIYLHLNKSTYIKGEDIAFAAYIFDKHDKMLSKTTSNLYVTIEDSKKNVIKKQLLLVKNGTVNNLIETDSLFTSDNYTLKAYTNWSLNFKEQLTYSQIIRVIDPAKDTFVEKEFVESGLDAQFLPESGHLLAGIVNTIGVTIKDSKGYGVPDLTGKVFDQDNNFISSFTTNEFGITQFPLNAIEDFNYHIELNHRNKSYRFPIEYATEQTGVVLSTTRLSDKIIVSARTNDNGINYFDNKTITLVRHNTEGLEISGLKYTDHTTVQKLFYLNDLAAGINVFTLFVDNQPVAERLFFNYQGLNLINLETVNVEAFKDSTLVKLYYPQETGNEFSSLSVSVLPKSTKSYGKNQNIISQLYLKPYLNGTIENAQYYFTNVDKKVMYHLDNLLLTQGWSSFSWRSLFKNKQINKYVFEQGISLRANVPRQLQGKETTYMLHAMEEQNPRYYEITSKDSVFGADNLYPIGQDELSFSRIEPNDDLKSTSLYLQFFPSQVPVNSLDLNSLEPKSDYIELSGIRNSTRNFEKLNKTTELDEVVINAKLDKERTRITEIKKKSFGRVKVLDQSMRNSNMTLADFLSFNGFNAYDDPASGQIVVSSGFQKVDNSENGSFGSSTQAPQIYIDDEKLMPFAYASRLYRFSLREVDYIEIQRVAHGGSMHSGGGVIRIHTLFATQGFVASDVNRISTYKLPLSFSPEKTYYSPKYRRQDDDFFKFYGTIDWKPNVTIDQNGQASFKIAKPEVPYSLYIEGIDGNNFLIAEKIDIGDSESEE